MLRKHRPPLLWVLLAGVVLCGTPPGARGDTDPQKQQVIQATVTQEIDLTDLQVKSIYKGTFKGGGFTRLDGKIYAPMLTGDAKAAIKMTMVSNNKALKQLVEVEGLVQLISYDLTALRKEFPEAEVGRDLDPRSFAEAVKHIKDKTKVRVTKLKGETVTVYEVSIEEAFVSAPMPGLASPIPQPKKMLVWMAADGLPRKVEAYDVKGNRFLATSFADLKLVDDVPKETFELKTPEDALELDMTEMVLEAFRAQKESGGK